jgi:hypothetical protein
VSNSDSDIAAIRACRRMKDICNALTARCGELRGLQFRLREMGLDEEASRLDVVTDRIELAFGVLVRTRMHLSISVSGTPDETQTRTRTGEWTTVDGGAKDSET